MTTQKTYTIDPFNLKKWKKEVFDSSITVKMNSVNVDGDQVECNFASSLSASEVTTLDGLASSHDGIALPDAEAVTSLGYQKVALYEPDGQSTSIVSHDWTDRTTWYQGSEQKLGETCVLDHDAWYNIPTRYDLIDLKSGKVTFEDKITGYDHVVYNDGVVVPESEITWDYKLGRLQLSVDYQSENTIGTITCDCWVAKKSNFEVTIPAGVNELIIKSSEIQFTTDVMTQPIYFEILALVAPNTWVPVVSNLHSSIKDIINIAREGKGVIPRCDGLRHDVAVFPIKYDRPIKLGKSPELKMVVRTKDDKPLSGEWATITFYTEHD